MPLQRKALTINGRRAVSLVSEFYAGETYDKSPTNHPRIAIWNLRGRQVNSGYGGGKVVGK